VELPYGAATLAGAAGDRTPSANELAIARFQGKTCSRTHSSSKSRKRKIKIAVLWLKI